MVTRAVDVEALERPGWCMSPRFLRHRRGTGKHDSESDVGFLVTCQELATWVSHRNPARPVRPGRDRAAGIAADENLHMISTATSSVAPLWMWRRTRPWTSWPRWWKTSGCRGRESRLPAPRVLMAKHGLTTSPAPRRCVYARATHVADLRRNDFVPAGVPPGAARGVLDDRRSRWCGSGTA